MNHLEPAALASLCRRLLAFLSTFGRLPISTIALTLLTGLVARGEARPPIRIGASLALSGAYAAPGQNQHRGYQLCVKHANEEGGVLGRKIELIVYDDQSEPATAVLLYEKLITKDKVNMVLGPYSSPITEAVAEVTEKYKMPMVAPMAATSSIFKKGRKFIFMMKSPAERYLEGLIDIARRNGLKTIALVNEDTLFAKTTVQGAINLAKKKGFRVVFAQGYPKGTRDFSAILTKVRAVRPDVLGAGTYFNDAVALTRQMRALNVNPKMYGVTVGASLPKFYDVLGRDAEFVYGGVQWVPELPYRGNKEFVESHKKEFPEAGISDHSAGGYAGCQILVKAIKRSGSLDGEKIRGAILEMGSPNPLSATYTVYGLFKVDQGGFQTSHKMVTLQWQDGKRVVVWPEEVASGKPRFPTPPWSRR